MKGDDEVQRRWRKSVRNNAREKDRRVKDSIEGKKSIGPIGPIRP